MYVLNVPVANLICQIIFDNEIYFGWFYKSYQSVENKTGNHHLQIISKKESIKQPKIYITQKYNRATINLPKRLLSFNYLSFLVETSIAALVIKQNILFLHASSLIINKKVYLFCGDVGAGKSTVRKLGKEYLSLSDDTTVVKRKEERFFVYPSPFDKNKEISIGNQKVLLEKIFILKKSDKNYIRDISSVEIIKQLKKNNLFGVFNPTKITYNFYKQNLILAAKIPIQKLYFTKSHDFLKLI